MGEKDCIWVSKELAAQYKALDSIEEQEASVKRVIEKKRLDLDAENELLGESLLSFKSVCLAHKKELEKVYQDQADKIYALWEEMGDVSSMISRHAKMVAGEVEPISRAIAEATMNVGRLKTSCNEMNIYGAERIVELARTVATMDDKTKELLSALFAHK